MCQWFVLFFYIYVFLFGQTFFLGYFIWISKTGSSLTLMYFKTLVVLLIIEVACGLAFGLYSLNLLQLGVLIQWFPRCDRKKKIHTDFTASGAAVDQFYDGEIASSEPVPLNSSREQSLTSVVVHPIGSETVEPSNGICLFTSVLFMSIVYRLYSFLSYILHISMYRTYLYRRAYSYYYYFRSTRSNTRFC